MKRKIALWVIGFATLIGLLWIAGWSEVRTVLGRFSPGMLLGLLALQLVTLGLIAYQWHYVLRRAEIPLPFSEVLAVNLAGGFVESVTPSSKLGGEAAKVYLFRRLTGAGYDEVSSALVVHKYVSLVPFFLLCVGIAGFAGIRTDVTVSTTASLGLLVVALSATVLTVALHRGSTADLPVGRSPLSGSRVRSTVGTMERLLPRRIRRSIDGATGFLRRALSNAGSLLTAADRRWLFLVSFFVWGLYPVKIHLVALMLGIDVGFEVAAVGTILAYLVSIAPLSPGGTGTFEGTLAVIFLAGGATFSEGFTVAILSRVVVFWFPLLLSAAAAAWLVSSDHRLSPDGLELPVGTARFRE
ncbi:putative flippase [Halalkaliarchaeum sp. AArc-CO]|uniref:lysylphosphatidylglycerol synthase transmembrane domain-containing protein n=1 Tax=unclassified Halalkaliarchaeum TaxID=2678344 RepID=UPI00217ECFB1|nr:MULTISPECIES: lysylphosphatidylglycerol synthase transmembrane domain-containing protein [unclassified Halalkaliarchaeum]MDR5672366.1 lysylphosphatidylglycerol synthase transmembrane domain-containing protein [Halalkaliarchaeum sp. AArc-GB]UWG50012.1 putative flippase [Halalkaliarchaeum sp. AArc-CO]